MKSPRLYDVIDTTGPAKGCRNNLFPLSLKRARILIRTMPSGNPVLRRVLASKPSPR